MKIVILDVVNTVSLPGKDLREVGYETVPNYPVIRMIQALSNSGFKIFVVTGRLELLEEKTIKWLDDHKVPFDKILMRKEDDDTINSQLKKHMLDGISSNLKDNDEVIMAVEAYDAAVEMYTVESIDVVQIRRGDI